MKTGKEIAKPSPKSEYRKLSWLCPKTRKIVQIQLHRLVWAMFKGIPENTELELNHLDGVKQNCKLGNLELTYSEGNVRHAIRMGLSVPHFVKGNKEHLKRRMLGNRYKSVINTKSICWRLPKYVSFVV